MNKNLTYKLKTIKGIGKSTLNSLRLFLGINIRKYSEFQSSYSTLIRIKKLLRVQKTGVLLQTIIKKRINNFILIKNYKGMRHKKGYPVRGQRTHTNAKTQKKLFKNF